MAWFALENVVINEYICFYDKFSNLHIQDI